MKLHGPITINDKTYARGENIPWQFIYPFFMVHMLAFGLSGFFLAYKDIQPDTTFLYMHGGFAIVVYTIFYLVLFGLDQVKWMFINGVLGLLGIYTQIDWLLSLFDRKVADFPWYIHAIPVLYYVLYTFLLRQALLDITRSRQNHRRRRIVEAGYVVASIAIYLALWQKA